VTRGTAVCQPRIEATNPGGVILAKETAMVIGRFYEQTFGFSGELIALGLTQCQSAP
jgi:hypothetical protein